jgi:hypothetical protein
MFFRMQDVGKTMVLIGLLLAAAGGWIWKSGSLGWLGKLGRLPGDILIHRGESTFYFPVATCVLISVLLTLLSWLLRR